MGYKERSKPRRVLIRIVHGRREDGFSPSPALIELLSKLPESDGRKVFINQKAEWLFFAEEIYYQNP